MSISTAFSNASSGLTATSRMTEVVSSNVANAMTEGYARRDVALSASTGGGVRIDTVSRVVSESLQQSLRLAAADAGNAQTRSTFLQRFEDQLGTPGRSGALSSAFSDLETALISASSLPDSSARLTAVATAAGALADKLNAVSADLQQSRLEADRSIATQVDTLNTALQQVAELNRTITGELANGRDANGLIDQRQALIAKIGEIVPVRSAPHQGGQVTLYTTGGALLLDGTSTVEIGFSPVGAMTADMTLAGGALSGLTINGKPISSTDEGVLGGGTLGAAFAVRDTLAPAAQSGLDALARNLIDRFADPSVDPTLGSGAAGLFTDAGAAFDAANETGLAGRIRLNALVDPAAGGEVWRLRDGLGAAVPGPVGDTTLLNALSEALTRDMTPASAALGTTARSASGLAAELLSRASTARVSAALRSTYTAAQHDSLSEAALSEGVDTDYEMKTLLQIEQSYAANAKVIRAIDDMMQRILEL